MNMRIVLTGTGTGIGRTASVAALARALDWFYWKSIQALHLFGDSSGVSLRRIAVMNISPRDFETQVPVTMFPATSQEFINVIAHYYRGEIARMAGWRDRIDRTMNWAITCVAAMLSISWSGPAHRHEILLFAMIIVSMRPRRLLQHRATSRWRRSGSGWVLDCDVQPSAHPMLTVNVCSYRAEFR